MPSWNVTHASANAAAMLGVADVAELFNRSIETFLPPMVVHDLRNTMQGSMVSGAAETLTNASIDHVGLCDLTVHQSHDQAIIEILPTAAEQVERTAPLNLLRSMLSRLRRAPNLERSFSMSVNQLRAVTGFDRVMIYKFLGDGSGQVIAEALRSGLVPFLGLHYPASDMPDQARELYKRQTVRLVPDVNYQPSPLLAAAAMDVQPLDLSLAVLRSVSPIHIEYLRNMGSSATVTISLMVGDRLWGLIACHHQAPRRLAPSICSACELFGQVFSLQIEAKEQARELSYIARSREAHERLIANMPPEETLFDNLARYADLLTDLISCDGLGVWTSGLFSGVGTVPPLKHMQALIASLETKDSQQIFATDAVVAEFSPAEWYRDVASGILAIPFSRTPRDYLLFFRRETRQVVNWAGDPNKPFEPSPDGERIVGRENFAPWREEVQGRSKPWHPSELKIAEALRVSLLDVILRRSDIVARERSSA